MTQDNDQTISMEQVSGEHFAGQPDDPKIQQKKADLEARVIDALKGNLAYLLVAVKPGPDGQLEIVTSVAGEHSNMPMLAFGVMSLMAKIQGTQEAILEREANPVPPSSLN